MPGTARILLPDLCAHLTQRGNQRAEMFFSEADYTAYLRLWRDITGRYALSVLGYCLMPNHVHWIIWAHEPAAISRAFGLISQRYSQYLNIREGNTGHRWQNRFFSCVVDDAHRFRALRYVERNPVRARLVEQAWDYPRSSAAVHCGASDPLGLLDMPRWQGYWSAAGWKALLEEPDIPGEVETFRLATYTGRPCGSPSFLAEIEQQTGRRLHPYSVGRPKKTKESKSERGVKT